MILIIAVSPPSLAVSARYKSWTSFRTRSIESFSVSSMRFSSNASKTALRNLSFFNSVCIHFSRLSLYRLSLNASLIFTISLLVRPMRLSIRSSRRDEFDWYQKFAQYASLSHRPKATAYAIFPRFPGTFILMCLATLIPFPLTLICFLYSVLSSKTLSSERRGSTLMMGPLSGCECFNAAASANASSSGS